MNLPMHCWVITSDVPPYCIKRASPSWFVLWQLTVKEALGKPISILRTPGSDARALARHSSDAQRARITKRRCINVRQTDGSLIGYDLEIEQTERGRLPHSPAGCQTRRLQDGCKKTLVKFEPWTRNLQRSIGWPWAAPEQL